ncbi:hypothetical protein Fmac_014766 [Flemingia macrophylla]|uniref:Uncharacterized protein n=1 Tax=Flemingia macrophylla TaxID=520843 RepID=A0ABD1MCM9_9FABA
MPPKPTKEADDAIQQMNEGFSALQNYFEAQQMQYSHFSLLYPLSLYVKSVEKKPSRVASQGHSTYVEPQLQPSKLAQLGAPTISLTSSVPIAQILVTLLVPQLYTIPHKTNRSNKSVCHGTLNLMSHALSQGHSTFVVPSLQPSKEAQPYASIITIIPLLAFTTQNTVSALDPPSYKMPQNAKYSNKRVCLSISNYVPRASSRRHSAPMELQEKYLKATRSCALIVTFIPPSNTTS